VRQRLLSSFVIFYSIYCINTCLDSLDSDISLKLTHELHKRKRRKNRTAFSAQQIYALEKRFTHQRYLTPNDRDQIANELQLSPGQVITVSFSLRIQSVNLLCTFSGFKIDEQNSNEIMKS
jgi:hypothetical protein